MKKAINIIFASVAIFSVLSLSAISAFASPSVELVEVSRFGAKIESGAYVYPTFDVVKDDSFFTLTTSVPAVVFYGYQMTLNYPAYMTVDPGYYFQISITTRQNSPSYTAGNLPSTSVSVVASDGVIYDLGVTTEMQSSSAGNYYVAIAGGYVGSGEPIHISSIVITSDCPVGTVSSATPSSYTITVYPSVSVVPTPEQQRHEELMQEIQDSTDKIVNGYTPDDGGAKDEFDDVVADLDEAEENLFQGKTADEWADQIYDALVGDTFDDLTNMSSASVTAFINNLLFTLGPEYTALIFLSCGLGIGLLAIGRVI